MVVLGLGWDSCDEMPIDVDSSCVMMKGNKIDEFIYYSNQSNNNNSIKLSGDNRTGEGEGDDEQIYINLNNIPERITSLLLVINIYTSGLSFSERIYMLGYITLIESYVDITLIRMN
jgi:stress response protein SCP2